MNIALVILHSDPARGGAERYTVDLAAALAGRGHEVSMLASSFAALGEHVKKVPLDSLAATRLGKYLRFLDSLDAHLAGHRYDVVHAMLPVRRCNLYHPHAGIAADAIERGHLKYAGGLRRALAATANRFNHKRRRFAAVERQLLMGDRGPALSTRSESIGPALSERSESKGPIVLCLSDYIRQSVRRHYPLPESRMATLLNAADLDKFDPAARPDAGRVVRERFGIGAEQVVALMVAHDFARKGLGEAIRAWREVNDERLVLLVVGKDDSRPYAALADGANHRNVIFAGATDDPYAFYRAADFFVLPTRHDPCSLVVLEALAMGLPVISTVFNGACEAMENGRHGFVLADPADVGALANAMRRLLDHQCRKEMARACLELRPGLSYTHHVDRLLDIYAGCCGSSGEKS